MSAIVIIEPSKTYLSVSGGIISAAATPKKPPKTVNQRIAGKSSVDNLSCFLNQVIPDNDCSNTPTWLVALATSAGIPKPSIQKLLN